MTIEIGYLSIMFLLPSSESILNANFNISFFEVAYIIIDFLHL